MGPGSLFSFLERIGALPIIVVGATAMGSIFILNIFLAFFVGDAIGIAENLSVDDRYISLIIVLFTSALGVVSLMVRSKAYTGDIFDNDKVSSKSTKLDKILKIDSKEFSEKERLLFKSLVFFYFCLQFIILTSITGLPYFPSHIPTLKWTLIAWFCGIMTDFLIGQLYAFWREKELKKKGEKPESSKGGDGKEKGEFLTLDERMKRTEELLKKKKEKKESWRNKR